MLRKLAKGYEPVVLRFDSRSREPPVHLGNGGCLSHAAESAQHLASAAISAQEATTFRADIKTAGRLCISILVICLLPRLHSQGKQ